MPTPKSPIVTVLTDAIAEAHDFRRRNPSRYTSAGFLKPDMRAA